MVMWMAPFFGPPCRSATRARCCKVTFRSHHTAQHGMRSTATRVAWSVYVSVCCRVTSVSAARNDWIDRDAVWVWTREAQGNIVVLIGAEVSYEKRQFFWEMVIPGHRSYSALPAIDIKLIHLIHKAEAAMWPLATTFIAVYFPVLVVLFIQLF